MAQTANSKLPILRLANTLNQMQGALSHTLARVSSSLQLISTADAAAGAGLAKKLTTRARSGREAMRNANDGISVVQTAESASREVLCILDGMRALAVESASGKLNGGEQREVDSEFGGLSAEVERIAQSSEFNDIALSDGTNTILIVQLGVTSGADSEVSITLGDLRATTLGVDTAGINLSSGTTAQSAINDIDTAIDSANSIRVSYGSAQNQVHGSMNHMTSYVESFTAAVGQAMDADYAQQTAKKTRLQVIQQAGPAAIAQARTVNQSVLSLLGSPKSE